MKDILNKISEKTGKLKNSVVNGIKNINTKTKSSYSNFGLINNNIDNKELNKETILVNEVVKSKENNLKKEEYIVDKRVSEKLKENFSIDEEDYNFSYNIKDQSHDENDEEEDDYEDCNEIDQNNKENSVTDSNKNSYECKLVQQRETKLNESIDNKNNDINNKHFQKSFKVDKLNIFKAKTFNPSDKEEFHDPSNSNSYIHQIYKRGSSININELVGTVECLKLRHKFKIVKLFYDKKEDYFLQPYIVYFDEFFMYFIKDIERNILNKDDIQKKIRLIGKLYNIKKIDKIKVCDYKEEIIKITITFKLHEINQEFEEENYIVKDIYFEINKADQFFKILNYFLNKYNIPMNIPNTYNSKILGNTSEK